jgi:hypothetical protein
MKCEENHSVWLTKMKLFCQELEVYLHAYQCKTFPKTMPCNENGEFDHLCEMSTRCTYISDIDIVQHNAIIFEIQSMARRLLIEIGKHPGMAFQSHQQSVPFFEKPLLIALSLAVEHQMHMHYLPQAKTICF